MTKTEGSTGRHFTVKSRRALDQIESEWRPTLGTGIINRAVHIDREPDRLTIQTETGATNVFTTAARSAIAEATNA